MEKVNCSIDTFVCLFTHSFIVHLFRAATETQEKLNKVEAQLEKRYGYPTELEANAIGLLPKGVDFRSVFLVCLFVHLSIHPSIYLPIHPSIQPFIHFYRPQPQSETVDVFVTDVEVVGHAQQNQKFVSCYNYIQSQ